MITALALFGLVLACLPATMTLWNLGIFRKPRHPHDSGEETRPAVSLLIPARNEEAGIGAAVRSALASEGVEVEVIVLDDGSTDATADIVRAIAADDGRVRLHDAPPLPQGWCGKQHACWVLASLARHDVLAWIDADVRLAPDALIRATAFLTERDAGLVSGFPRQHTVSLGEQLVVPLIHQVLLGYLPMAMMRESKDPGFGAGCGQFFVARRDAYEAVGGHAVIKASMHDGVTLPRAFRRAGFMTDAFDATDLATCRMYRSFPEVWRGFAKNATEGMASIPGIFVWTILLGGAFVLPVALTLLLLAGAFPDASSLAHRSAIAATITSYTTSLLVMVRFRQTWLTGLLRPIGVALLLAIQWYALTRKLAGFEAAWKGRAYLAPSK
jgi:glycosyltransferase involved in cell wall biosynthesis